MFAILPSWKAIEIPELGGQPVDSSMFYISLYYLQDNLVMQDDATQGSKDPTDWSKTMCFLFKDKVIMISDRRHATIHADGMGQT